MTGDSHPNNGHHHNEEDYGTLGFPLYTRPVQRQKWGERQSTPHTNFGDTFFDLFYVAAAYNLGNLIRQDPSWRGLLYFAGCFWPTFQMWSSKLYYDARYYTRDDLWHRLYDLATIITLATAVLHIRSVDILSTPEENMDMFIFALSVAIGMLLSIGRFVEIIINVEGQEVAKVASKRDVVYLIVSFGFYLSAAIVAAVKHFGDDDDDSAGTDAYYGSTDTYKNDTTQHDDGHLRFLAAAADDSYGSTTKPDETDLPIWLCIGGAVTVNIGLIVLVCFLLPSNGRHKEVTVPMNVSFTIHRYGEFVMLMLGETVLSLLIVDTSESSNYYKAFFSGIISITVLEYLHFRSQPHKADAHAMRRSKEAGIAFSMLMQLYSAALIVLGTTYKMILYEFAYESDYSKRRSLFGGVLARFLAGSDSSPKYPTDERQQRIAHLFGGSMALVWLCMDAMILTHRGIKDNLGRCRFENHDSTNKKVMACVLVLIRFGLIALLASLSQYETAPVYLALIGLAGIICQVILRFIATSQFGDDDDDRVIPEGVNAESYRAARAWPNTTQARVVRKKVVSSNSGNGSVQSDEQHA
mmetsp:Transcript_8766/g.25212  ORF Transcript_8766/g.25212 Transcript_8766/m.25212 type:complete len:582 (+) Transcript_8766:182-1927(+)